MTSRVLPQAEWDRLAGTEVAPIVAGLDPENTQVLVIEQDGQIVGTWAIVRLVHVECVWVHPDHRGKASVAARLLAGMRVLARRWGATGVWTGAVSPDVEALIEKLGGLPVPGAQFVIPLGVS